jgi:Tfp pilus assembly protein PilF
MKKIVLLTLLFFTAATGFSQKNMVVSAFNYHKSGKLDKAKDAIDKATVHPKSISMAKTWYYRGNIYIDIYRSTNEEYKKLDPDALNVAYDAYQKALELDEKKTFYVEILARMPMVGESFFNYGANLYNSGQTALNNQDTVTANQEFGKAVNAFENAYKIYKDAGSEDSLTIYYIAVAAELGEDYDKAKEALETLIAMNYPEPGIYSSLAGIYYKQDKDAEKAASTYTEGRTKYPDNLSLLLNETNFLLAEQQTDKALGNLELAAEIDTTNATIFFAIGANYNQIVDDSTSTEEMREVAFGKAVDAYDKAIKIKPDYFDPNYNMGALYVNKAAVLIDEANQLPFEEQKKYDELKERADGYLNDCLPYLEKAHQIDASDMSTLYSLKEIYARLGNQEKLDQIKLLIDANN